MVAVSALEQPWQQRLQLSEAANMKPLTTFAMAPRHRFRLTGRHEAQRAAQAATFELITPDLAFPLRCWCIASMGAEFFLAQTPLKPYGPAMARSVGPGEAPTCRDM
jgi:hypothetical protein